MKALERVVDALRSAGQEPTEPRAGQWRARCPAHGGTSATSLSVHGIAGSVLLHCFADCETSDVVAALNLTMADLYDEPRGAAYKYGDGRVVHRSPDKRFRQSGNTSGRPQLFRLAAVREAVAAGRPVYVVEGEKDVLALESVGAVATCAPMGAGRWGKVDDTAVHGGTVVVVADKDAPGRKHAADVTASLAEHADVVVVEALVGKDAADHVAAGYDVAELVPVEPDPAAGAPTTDTGPGPAHPGPVKVPGRAPSVATQLIELGRETYRFGQSVKSEPFAVPLAGPNVARMLRGAGGSLRSELGAAYFTEHGKAAPQQALADAVSTLEGFAAQAEPEALHLRSAVHHDAVWVDLGDGTGRAVEITTRGWSVQDVAPVLFTRTALTAALPTPERDGRLAELWALLNVTDDDRPLVLGWQLAALLTPDLPCPVLALLGEQGTGKTTASKRLAALVDPAYPQVRRSPKDGEAWVSAATGSRVVALDNVSAVPEWFSDALCRAVTGDGDVRRRLYSDGDFHVIAFRRAVIVNGIDLGAVRDDLAERLLTVQLARITEDHRGRESDLEHRWTLAHPRVFGALLDLAVRVLAERDGCLPDALPRMADFAHTLATVDHVLGTTGLARYRAQAGELAADAVDSDPVLRAIATRVRQTFEGTGAELLDLITDPEVKSPKGWPGTAKAMTGELRRKAPALRRLGWAVDDLGRGGRDKVLRWSLTPPAGAGMVRASDGHGGHQTGIGEPSCPHDAPALTCDDPAKSPNAGMTGMEPRISLPSAIKESKREGFSIPERVRAEIMPVMPVMPAGARTCSVCAAPLADPHARATGRCSRLDGAHQAARRQGAA